jgi:hypothetical protein
LAIVVLAAGAALASRAPLAAQRPVFFNATLDSFQEVPAIVTGGNGTLQMTLVNPTTLEFTLTYGGLEGGNVLFAHIHVGQLSVNGGVSAFFCGGGSKPACPASAPANAPVTGMIVPADVIGPAGQGVNAGNFDKLVRAMRGGVTYGNVHTMTFPGGEIRGQLH